MMGELKSGPCPHKKEAIFSNFGGANPPALRPLDWPPQESVKALWFGVQRTDECGHHCSTLKKIRVGDVLSVYFF